MLVVLVVFLLVKPIYIYITHFLFCLPCQKNELGWTPNFCVLCSKLCHSNQIEIYSAEISLDLQLKNKGQNMDASNF